MRDMLHTIVSIGNFVPQELKAEGHPEETITTVMSEIIIALPP
jgi:hypothetical protein